MSGSLSVELLSDSSSVVSPSVLESPSNKSDDWDTVVGVYAGLGSRVTGAGVYAGLGSRVTGVGVVEGVA